MKNNLSAEQELQKALDRLIAVSPPFQEIAVTNAILGRVIVILIEHLKEHKP